MSNVATQIGERVEVVARTARYHWSRVQSKLHTTLQNANIPPKAALYAGLLLVTCVWFVATFTRHVRKARRDSTQPSTPNLEKRSPFKAPDRPPGGKHLAYPVIPQSFFNIPSCRSLFSVPQLQPRPQHTLSLTLTNKNDPQYGTQFPSRVPKHPLTQTGPSQPPSPSPTAPSATAPSTTSPWASAPCTGTNGSSSTMSTSPTTR